MIFPVPECINTLRSISRIGADLRPSHVDVQEVALDPSRDNLIAKTDRFRPSPAVHLSKLGASKRTPGTESTPKDLEDHWLSTTRLAVIQSAICGSTVRRQKEQHQDDQPRFLVPAK
jgi:hypothetical protein